MPKKRFKLNILGIIIKAVATGIPFAFLYWLVNIGITLFTNLNVKGAEYILLFISGLVLTWALAYRDGTENIFEALVSLAFISSVYGLITVYTGLTAMTTNVVKMPNLLLFFAVFFIAESVTQRFLRMYKLI